ncbi:uncharacterized protein KIAA1755 homolog [Hemicordylus capensis]|uniref:uncharacterized protein KIAA1755 homolog n=1 Tax=Hemicordylus capensis TaxID=884348 RepID=UPI0023046E10|nr:uncharacterized protein KIAA1755 homolog [Hemicordylus capensis]
MDQQSLDAAVQNTLSGLYPPFDITAPTVLSQLFRVLEARYHGDGLCCLLDFLIPSKRLLEHVRQAACAPYFSRVFLHEGWPLCLHEKVVVHLGPLNPLLLRPGDFYLQAEPCGEQSACLMVKCLSRDLTTVEKLPVPEASCSWLFTREWLEEINQDLDWARLHTCLVATGNGIVPVPWSKIATPEFVNRPQMEGLLEQELPACPEASCTSGSQRQNSSTLGHLHSTVDGGLRPTQGKYPGLIKVEAGSWQKSTLFVVPSLCDIIGENLEGEYVNLLEYPGEGKLDSSSPAKSTALAAQPSGKEASPKTKKEPVWENGEVAPGGSWTCGKGQEAEEGPCTPCLRRKLSPDPKAHEEPRCRYRQSYVAALQNPVSFSSGLMAAILEEIDLSQPASPSDSADLQPERSDQAAPGIPSEHPNKGGKVEEASRPGHLKLLKPPAESPAASHKFSFLKGHRQLVTSAGGGGGVSVPEKASKGQEGPRKRAPLVCSPRMARAKPAAGKGTSQADVLLELPMPKSMDDATVTTTDVPLKACLPPGSGPQELVLWESLSPELLSSGVVSLPGNVDRLGRPILQISTSGRAWHAPWCSAREVTRLLLCLCSIPRSWSNDVGLTVVIDARKEPPPAVLAAALRSTQKASPGCICAVLLLAEKDAASHLEKMPGVQVELLSSLKALSRHVDSSQLTHALEGSFPYCHSEWVQYFQKVHHFVSDLRAASELLQNTIQELEKGGLPETLQEVEQQMNRHQQLMQDVLCNAQLVGLQREGGATLARLRREAARLSSSPDVRSSIGGALALYNLLEEEVHTLVTKSNSRLEHLEFLMKIRELEAEFSKLSSWFDDQGESELWEAAGSAECSRESTEESYRRFKEFFKEATVHYNRGLSLSKEAAKVQGSQFPEMGAFERVKGAFQAKLTVFYMDMEMRGAELETLLDLHKFCDEAARFHLDCKQRLAAWRAGEEGPESMESLREVESALQLLVEEFPAERFQQMRVQASSMRNKTGLAVWSEALERSQEAKQLLEDALAKHKGAQEEGVGDCKGVKGSGGAYLAPLDTALEFGDPEARTLEGEAPERLRTASQPIPLRLPADISSSHAHQVPGSCENLLSTQQPCISVPMRGQSSRRKETAQYFQLSRHGSFSSEDTDSQNSTEDPLSFSATLPMESPGPKRAWSQEKARGIVYLEKHSSSSSSPTAATSQ